MIVCLTFVDSILLQVDRFDPGRNVQIETGLENIYSFYILPF